MFNSLNVYQYNSYNNYVELEFICCKIFSFFAMLFFLILLT